MRAKEFVQISEDDPLGSFIQKKGLLKPNSADQFAAAIEQEDDIAKLATGKIDSKTLHTKDMPGVDTRTTGPTATAQAKASAVPQQNVKPTQLPPVKTASAPVVKKSAPQPATKIQIHQQANTVPWKDISDYCRSKWNLSVEQVSGMLANIQHESGFKAYDQHTDSNGLTAGGLFSHNGPRFTALTKALGPGWKQNWKGQVDFAMNEREGKTFRARQYSTPSEASMAWTQIFEKPKFTDTRAVQRAPTASKYYNGMQ